MATKYTIRITKKGYFSLFGRSEHAPTVLSDITKDQLDILDGLGWTYQVLNQIDDPRDQLYLTEPVNQVLIPTIDDLPKVGNLKHGSRVIILDTSREYLVDFEDYHVGAPGLNDLIPLGGGGSGGGAINWIDIINKPSSTVQAIDNAVYDINNNVLKLNNSSVYTPSGDYNPATKKYVDDLVGSANLSGYMTKSVYDPDNDGIVDATLYAHTAPWTGISNIPSEVQNLVTLLNAKANVSDVLTKSNSTPFTPTNDYNPATKKYVDDSLTNFTLQNNSVYRNHLNLGTGTNQINAGVFPDEGILSTSKVIITKAERERIVDQNIYDALVASTTADGSNRFATMSDISGITSDHNSLTNIQGGEPGAYYHLTQSQFDNLVLTSNTAVLTNKVIDATQNTITNLTDANVTELSISKITNLQTLLNGLLDLNTYDTNSDGIVDGADEAAKLTTPRLIELTGDITGSAYFDGSSDITINVVSNYMDLVAGTGITLTEIGGQLVIASDGSGGTGSGGAELIAGTGIVLTPNVDNTEITISVSALPGSGDMLASTYDTNTDGVVNAADVAYSLYTAREIALDGAVSGSATFDGSGDITITTTAITPGIVLTAGSGIVITPLNANTHTTEYEISLASGGLTNVMYTTNYATGVAPSMSTHPVDRALYADTVGAVAWNDLTGKPVSSILDIDEAVTNSHTHTLNELTILGKFTEVGGVLYYNGVELAGGTGTGSVPTDILREVDYATIDPVNHKVDHAITADGVAWSGVTGVPNFALVGHTHDFTELTGTGGFDFNDAMLKTVYTTGDSTNVYKVDSSLSADVAKAIEWDDVLNKPIFVDPSDLHTHADLATLELFTAGYKTQLDQALTNNHTHTNLMSLNKISEVSGVPTWNGGAWPLRNHMDQHLQSGADAFPTETPVQSMPGDSNIIGTSNTYALADHKHARENWGSTSTMVVKVASSAGSSNALARADHTHQLCAHNHSDDATGGRISYSNLLNVPTVFPVDNATISITSSQVTDFNTAVNSAIDLTNYVRKDQSSTITGTLTLDGLNIKPGTDNLVLNHLGADTSNVTMYFHKSAVLGNEAGIRWNPTATAFEMKYPGGNWVRMIDENEPGIGTIPAHDHNTIYYTKTEVDGLVGATSTLFSVVGDDVVLL